MCQLSAKEKKNQDLINKSQIKDSKLVKGAKLLNSVLNPFVQSKTVSNQHASRAGKWTEMQFNAKVKLVGLKLLDYLLEKPRVTACPTNERNFDVFYLFLAGATPEERHEFHLHDASKFKYLNNSNASPASNDHLKYTELLHDMKAIGIGKRQQHELFKIIAAILHLGNIEFADEKDLANDPASIVHYNELDIVASLLGVEAVNLESR